MIENRTDASGGQTAGIGPIQAEKSGRTDASGDQTAGIGLWTDGINPEGEPSVRRRASRADHQDAIGPTRWHRPGTGGSAD